MSDLVLVTGISGFLGGRVALGLLKAGYRVRGSLRSLDKADHVRDVMAQHGADASKLEFCALDLLNDDGWDDAMRGVKYLQHVASPFFIHQPTDRMDLIRPAVEGTERALNAALNNDVERIVLTSSSAALMYGHDPDRKKPFTADDWTKLDTDKLPAYIESKTRAELRAWEIMDAAKRHNDLTTINPVAIFGPLLDSDPGTSSVLIQRLMNGSTPAAPRLSFPIIDVRDVAELHIKAMTTQQAGGHRYPLSAGTEWMMELARGLAKRFPAYASKAPKFTAPDWLVHLVALTNRDIRGRLGKLGLFKEVDAADAIALLGHNLISIDDAIDATMQSMIDHKLL